MVPGPKPKPAEIAAMQGNPGHRPVVAAPATSEAPAIEVAYPDWLDDMGRAIWEAYMPRMRAMGYVRDTDRLSFARLCDHTARWMKLRLKVNEKGESYTTESRHGKMERINPDFAAMLRVEDKMVQLEDRFGLTPMARQQILKSLSDPTIPTGDMFGTAKPVDPDAPRSPLGMFAPVPRSQAN